MMGQDLGLPGAGIDVSVNLRGENALVAQHFLHDTQVGTILDHMGSKRMPESMRRNGLANAGLNGALTDHIEHGNATQRLPETIKESKISKLRRRNRPHLEPRLKRIQRRLPDWHQTLLVPLPDDPHEETPEIDMRNQQPASLRNPKATTIKYLQDSPVANTCGTVQGYGIKNSRNLLHRKHFRKITPQLGSVHRIARIVLPLPLQHQEIEIGPQRTQRMCLTPLAKIPGTGSQITLHVSGSTILRTPLQERKERRNLGAIRRHRIRRKLPLYSKMIRKTIHTQN